MKLFSNLDEIQLQNTCLAIGAYDGVHLGHQSIIKAMVAHANEKGYPACVLSFEPHPSEVLTNRSPIHYLTTPSEKAALLSHLGVDKVVVHPFDMAFSRLSAASFLDLVQSRLQFSSIWVGEDFRFGQNREGDIAYLQEQTGQRNFELRVMPRFELGDVVVKSSTIRNSLAEGDLEAANALLGRPYSIQARIEMPDFQGDPVNNVTFPIRVSPRRALPGSALYAASVVHPQGGQPALVQIEPADASEDGEDSSIITIYLSNIEMPMIGKNISLNFIARLHGDLYLRENHFSPERLAADRAALRRIVDETPLDLP